MSLVESILSAFAVDDDRDDDPVRSYDEIEAMIDELDEALEDPANDFEYMANRASRDALVWALGVDRQDVVVDMEAYEQGEA